MAETNYETPKTDYEAMIAKHAAHALPGRVVRQITGPGKVYEFGAGVPDPGAFPVGDLARATADMLGREGQDLVLYPGPMGFEGLRRVVAKRLEYYEGLTVSLDNIMLVNGTMQGIQLLTEALIDPGDVIIVEDLTYMGSLRVFRRWKARLVGVPMDDEGMVATELEKTLASLRAEGAKVKLIYVITDFQNPTGVTLSQCRRAEIARIAKEHGVLVLEDDSYGELRCEGDWVPSIYQLDDAGLVVRMGTFSKIIGAGVRQGWMLVPAGLLPHIQGLKMDGGTNALASRIIASYLEEHMVPRIARVQEYIRVKRDAMLQALQDYLGAAAEWTHPEGGMFIWVRLPEGTDPERLWETAATERIVYVPGWNFTVDGQGARNYIRLCYGYPTPEDIREGVQALARAIQAAGGILNRPVPTP